MRYNLAMAGKLVGGLHLQPTSKLPTHLFMKLLRLSMLGLKVG